MRAFVVVAVLVLAPIARAASPTCTSDAQCTTAGQKCRTSEGLCVWEATDAATLTAAITAANGDAARDVICIGTANPPAPTTTCDDPAGPDPTCVHITFTAPGAATDATLGALAVPAIIAPLTIEGCGPDASFAVLDDNDDLRLFLVHVDATLNVAPDLTLKNVTLQDARPGEAPAGQHTGGGAVHVTAAATTTGALATFTAANVVFNDTRDSGVNGDAQVVVAGGDVTMTNCTFEGQTGTVAADIASSCTHLRVIGGTFDGGNSDNGAGAIFASSDADITSAQITNNSGAVGAIDFAAGAGATGVNDALQIAACTFDSNNGDVTGGVRGLGGSTSIVNSTFTNNAANGGDSTGGAVFARSLTIRGGTFDDNTAPAGGGAVAISDAAATPSDAVDISDAEFGGNSTGGTGGALFVPGATVTLDGDTFDGNSADGGGGAVYLQNLADRNGAATPDASITNTTFTQNFALLSVGIGAGDVPTLDEKGDQKGLIVVQAVGEGSALVVDGTGLVQATQSCFTGNAAVAVEGLNAGAVRAEQNWWGAATGPFNTGGDGDSIGQGVDGGAPLAAAPPACSATPRAAFPQVFVNASVTTDGAQIGVDYQLLDHDRPGVQVLKNSGGDIEPDTRRGLLDIDVVGTNRVVQAATQSFIFSLLDCSAEPCAYHLNGLQSDITMLITDNGTGVGEGEGEGGPACAESLDVSPASVVLPDTGKPAEASFTVKNTSSCDVQLLAPFVQKGASQGFGVKPVAQANLALHAGDSVVLVATFTPPDNGGDNGGDVNSGANAGPAGTILLETAGGTIKQVQLSLSPSCACTSSRASVPEGALACLAVLGLVGARRRRR